MTQHRVLHGDFSVFEADHVIQKLALSDANFEHITPTIKYKLQRDTDFEPFI